jgi:hypothetical protein
LCATFPGNGNDGFLRISGSGVRIAMVTMCLALALLLLANAAYKLADHELVFGGVTIFTALTLAAAFISVFLRRHVEDQAGRMFVPLAALSVLLLVLAAYDWERRQLLVAAVVIAAALSMFIVRAGFESLKVPPQWERAQIAAQTQVAEDALTLQYKEDLTARRNAAIDARTALGHVVNGPPKPNVDGGLLTAAQGILTQSYRLIQQGKVENADDFSRFDTLVANEDPTKPPAATSRLADAVHALQTAEAAAAVPVSKQALDQAICMINPPPSGKCGAGLAAAITTNRAWVTAKHELDVQLAVYRAQVTGTQADQSALQAVLAQQPNADQDISILSAIQGGPETLWRSAFHASEPALVPGPLGWVLLGAVLLGLLSWLLKQNARQLAGPVSVPSASPDGGSGQSSGGNDQLTAALRVAVLQNVAEPGAAPGSPSINPVTSLLDIAGGPLSAFSKIIQAVQGVVGQRYGYQVAIDVASGDLADSSLVTGGAGTAAANSPRVTAVLVRVMSLTSGTTYASHLCEAPDAIDAVRTAGLWAAGNILNRSSRIPHWAAWEAETAHALVTAKNKTGHNIPALKAALVDAPNSGILLVLLGHRYELAGQPSEAIECYARAVAAYPRYAVARYRLAIAVAAMRHDEFGWRCSPAQADSEDSMLRAVQSAAKKLEVNVDCTMEKLIRKGDQANAVQDRAAFKRLAVTLLCSLEHDAKRRYLLVDALRRSERKSVWPALEPMSKHPAARFPGLVRSARKAFSDKDPAGLDADADADGSWWQISYNAACRHAADINPAVGEPASRAGENSESRRKRQQAAAERALEFLEQTLVRPGVEQLSADWVSHDPDLAALRALPRFKRFLIQLRPCE